MRREQRPTKRVAVVQSNYIPWKGYFDVVRNVDLFVFYDDVQYTKFDWRNRNRIKTEQGSQWLTIPVGTDTRRTIRAVQMADPHWQQQHWRKISHNYSRARHYRRYSEFFRDIYLGRRWRNLSELNQFLIRSIARDFLGIDTEFANSHDYAPAGAKLDRLLDILAKVEATHYVSGPAGGNYIDPARFEEAGIELLWHSYSGYPEYEQLFPPFEHAVSIIDVLFNVGPDAPEFIWGWRGRRRRSA